MIAIIMNLGIGICVAGYPELSTGDKGASVTSLQQSLFIFGYLSSKPTGTFDQTTKAAVVKFQKEQKLSADGIVGTRTWQRFEQMAAVCPYM
jgi:peptidoglycan hydrolase-like protein with peptidoglycan-binding domain